jgi:hypothetical protein
LQRLATSAAALRVTMPFMLRSRTFGGSLVVFALFAALASAQTTVKLKSNAGKNPLQIAIAELTVPSHMKMAQQKLWQAGEAAVPLLAAEVERGGAGESAALFVLEKLSGEAEAAVPVLQRIVAGKATEPRRRARIASTLAKIDGPPMLLVPLYLEGAVVELDFDGNENRRVVAGEYAWRAWPEPEDRIGALSYTTGSFHVLTWSGKEVAARTLRKSTGSFVMLDGTPMDGAMIITSWIQQQGQLIRFDAADKDVWTKQIDAIGVERDFGNELFVLTRAEPRIVWFSLDGAELRSMDLPGMYRKVQLLPDGGLVAASKEEKICVLAPDGTQLSEFVTKGMPNDMVRLRDGRTFVSTNRTVALYAKDGSEVWSRQLGFCGPLFVRAPAPGGR